MKIRSGLFHAAMLSGVAIITMAGAAHAEEITRYNIPPQSLGPALREFGYQSGHTILADSALTSARTSHGLAIESDPETALRKLLDGTGLSYKRNGDVFAIVFAANETIRRTPVAAVAPAESVSGSAVEGLVVTAQKRREAIQDVPIAISAFSADSLQAQKIEGGFDLLKAIPNVTFSKNNFSGYNFSIRGIGTKAISVATDPGVAVEFNDTPILRNRLFEQEYFDVERVEVLRGPQGTLHGRNATAGVINVLSNKADLDEFDGSLKGEVGNFHSKRLSGFVNVPLIEDVLAVRFAGSLTNRDGYDYNSITQARVNGRDLWSGRLSIGFEPTEKLRADFIWERFNEDDNRSRTGKQLCKHDPGPETMGTYTNLDVLARAAFSQGCLPTNLYDDAAFGTPNGLSIPFMLLGAGGAPGFSFYLADGPGGNLLVDPVDPYGGMRQSRDLREIASVFNPKYRAKADIFELNVSYDLSPSLIFTSQTLYNTDSYYATQDYNRFNSNPVIRDTSADYIDEVQRDADGFPLYDGSGNFIVVRKPSLWAPAARGGFFCDPQLGCSNTIAGLDMSRAKTTQFSQEFRLQSDFDGALNFSIGANYTRYRTVEDYFVFFNLITAVADALNWQGGELTVPFGECKWGFYTFRNQLVNPLAPEGSTGCVYIDPNPLESINGDGHNYFRSQNPYTLKSAALFGEAYWQASEALKFTAGLRYTDDRKTFTRVPSQVLLSAGYQLGGKVDRGYPTAGDLKQHWGKFSGRLGVDWKPELSFTDDTLLYAFYSHGYKGGGANPPGIGYEDRTFVLNGFEIEPQLFTAGYSPTFDPEFVDAFEVGAKNTLLQGALVVNLGAFFYDYKNYQVSKIVDRTAVNENFDATVWGLELESVFSPNEHLRINMSAGYQDTKIGDGERSIDLMDRTQGVDGYVVLKPWVQLPSNCVVTVEAVQQMFDEWFGRADAGIVQLCPGSMIFNMANVFPDIRNDFPNGGQGVYADLSGNELPNAPHFTVSLGAQYEWDILDGNWRATVRGDAYWQSQSFARVYNQDPYDKLHGWYNTNLSFWLEKPSDDLKIEFYVKNVLDDTPITDAFLNSDDTSLTTNIFTLDPRLIGLQVTKGF